MTASAPIPVVIIHRDPLVRACLATALADRAEIDVRDVVDEAALTQEPLGETCEGVIVADHATALLLTHQAMRRRPLSPSRPPVVVVSSCDREWELRGAMERRVRGYLSPGFDALQLLDCLLTVHRGSRYLCPRAAARLAESLSYEALTERETAVLRLVVKGLPNKSIGRELDISVGTVKSHLKAAYAKLEVASRTQSIAEAQRRGLLEQVNESVASRPPVSGTALHASAAAVWLARSALSAASTLRAA
jgi:DNA-binding NarL/FixJ family response regulator